MRFPAKLNLEIRKKSYFSFRKWIIIVALILMGVFIWSSFLSGSSAFRYIFSGQSSLKQTNGRVNILLLGIGGANHDGPNLTDSIIVASYDLQSKNVTLFSIPRDLWLPNINEKVNTAYQIGLNKQSLPSGDVNRKGLSFAEDKIDDVLGIPIHYGIVIDFSGFSRAIDQVGGLDVSVPNTFDDYEYPLDGKENDLCGWKEGQMTLSDDQAKSLNVPPGNQRVYLSPSNQIATDTASLDFSCRYEHIHFDKGIMHMDGVGALKFVRSRHALGIEGSDFARSRRQQLVIESFRNKIFSPQTIFNPQKLIALFDTLGNSVTTDIPKGEFPKVYTLSKNAKKIHSVVLGDLGGGESILINPPISQYGAWVLTPPDNNSKLIMDFVKTTLDIDAGLISSSPSATPSQSTKSSR